MSYSELFFYIFLAIGVFNLVHLGLYITGANFYDIWQFRRQKKQPQPRRSRADRPLVTVLIPAHNEELGIVRCLETVTKSTYRKLQIIVIDDASTDNTRKLVRDYIAKNPKEPVQLLYRRKNSGKAGALNYALKFAAEGELVMTLDADSVLSRDAIKNAVAYFRNPKVVGVAANVRIMDSPTILGLLQKFEHMIGYRSKKFYTITNSEFIVGGVASTYRREVMQEVGNYDTTTQTEDIGLSMKIIATGNRARRIVYAADVVAMTEGVQTFKQLMRQRYRWKLGSLQNLFRQRHLVGNNDAAYSRMLTMYRIPMAFFSEFLLLMEPFILAYVIYLTIVFQSPMFFLGAYMTITAYVLWTIWPDEHSSWVRKLAMSFYAPVMYFIFYIMNAVQVISIMRCLIHPKKIVKLNGESTWVSPERSGQAVQVG